MSLRAASGREDRALDIVKLSTGVTGYSDTEVTKSNVVPIRSSKTNVSGEAAPTQEPGDRFTRSSAQADMADGVTDRLTLSSAVDSESAASARDARVARVIASVQSGTYQVDSGAVATAVMAKMTNPPAASAEE